MLPKINRLKNKKDFEKIFKNGKRFKEEFLLLIMIKNNIKTTRFGIVVSQKVSKKATLRNKIKRWISEIIRLKIIKKIKKGFDILLIAVPEIEFKNFWEIEEVINKLFKKANIIEE